jgi:hypothetical protein
MVAGRANYTAPPPRPCGDCGERPVQGRIWHVVGCEFDNPADHRRLIPGPEPVEAPQRRLVAVPAPERPALIVWVGDRDQGDLAPVIPAQRDGHDRTTRARRRRRTVPGYDSYGRLVPRPRAACGFCGGPRNGDGHLEHDQHCQTVTRRPRSELPTAWAVRPAT